MRLLPTPEQALWFNIQFLRWTGSWPNTNPDGSLRKDRYAVLAVIMMLTVYTTFNFSQTGGILLNLDDLEGSTAAIFVACSSMLVLVKVLCMLFFFQLLTQLAEKRDADIRRRLEQNDVILGPLLFWRTVYMIFFVVVEATLLLMGLNPILDGSFWDKRLALVAWVPFETDSSPIFEFVFCYQALGVLILGTCSLNIDNLFYSMLMYISCECDAICDTLNKLEYKTDESFDKTLITCAMEYLDVVEYSETVKKVFSITVLAQFFCSTFAIAVSLFQLTVVDPTSGEGITMIFYAISCSFQIFLYCWYSNEILLKSANIPRSLFQTDWLPTSTTVRKNITFFMLRTQRPIQISSLGLIVLSLETFKKIMQTAWSYFAVLQQVHGK